MTKKDRIIGLDILKTMAVIFVIVLHINGYCVEQVGGLSSYSFGSKVVFFLLEAVAYPAIHLFVLISSWFMVGKTRTIKSCVKVYSQTWTVTVIGLFIAIVLIPSDIKTGGVLQSIFPFTQRAYWFVSDYLVLAFLAPFISNILEKADLRRKKALLTFMLVLTTVLPFISVASWDRSNLLLFILLYLVADYMKHYKEYLQKRPSCFLPVWIVLVLLLTASGISISLLSTKYTALSGKELVLYQYCSPFVVFEAIALFGFFITRKEGKRRSFPRLLSWICSSSLIIYLLHMHPIFKEVYTRYGLLQYINVNNPLLYLGQVIITAIIILAGATLIGQFIINPISRRIEGFFYNAFSKCCKDKESNNV